MADADRELLELAAKAAGLGPTIAVFGVPPFMGLRVRGGRLWNPLTDDGDAFRLAVKLRIHISQQLTYCATLCPHGDNSTRGIQWTEDYKADPLAATRRAIVRAAAEIGRGIARPISFDLPEDNYYKTQAEAEEIGRAAAEIGKALP